MTKALASQIVRQCIREISRTRSPIPSSITLAGAGIDTGTRLAALRRALLRAMSSRRLGITYLDLKFSAQTTIGDLVFQLARVGQQKPTGSHTGAAKPTTAGLTKTQLVRHIAEKLDLTNKQVGAFFDLLTETALKETKKNGVFVLPGLGRLVRSQRKARMGRNPQTGEQIKVRSKTAVKFHVAKPVKNRIAPAAFLALPPTVAEEGIPGVSVRDFAYSARESLNEYVDHFADSDREQLNEYVDRGKDAVERGRAQWNQYVDRGLQVVSEADAQATPLMIVRATPQMEFNAHSNGPRYPVVLYLDQSPAAAGAIIEPAVLNVPAELKECQLEVWMDSSPQLKIEGLPKLPQVTLNVTAGESDKLELTLVVAKTLKNEPMYLSAFFRYRGRPCGKITRFLSFSGKRLRWKTTANRAPESVLSAGPDEPSVVIEHGAEAADIRVEVTEASQRDRQHYCMTCIAGKKKWKGPWILAMKSDDLVKAHMNSFMTARGMARIAALQGAGQEFWNVLPNRAKKLIHSAIIDGAKTMSVLSEEPFVPWELMIPHTTPYDTGEPLGITLKIGRWITGRYIAPPQKVRLQSILVISPAKSGLSTAEDEVKFLLNTLKDQWKPGSRLDPATVTAIDNGLAESARDVLHFVCHGDSGVLQTLKLDTPDVLTSAMVLTLRGFLAAFKSRRPLVFLNACNVGKLTPGLAGISGFATSFMKLNSSGVVAPLWAVQDKAAFDVAKRFYKEALRGVPFASVLQEIRKEAYRGEAPLDAYAAYCFYGDPIAVASAG